MLPDFTLFLKQAHMDEIYELSMRPLLHALLKRQNKKGGIFFFPLKRVKSHRREVRLCSPGHGPGQRRALSQQRSSPGAAGSDSGEGRYKQETRCSFAPYLSSRAPGWTSTAYGWERSGMPAMMATNVLASERGRIRLLRLPAGGRLLSRSGAAAPEHRPSPGTVPPWFGAPAPSPPRQEGTADGEGGG